MTGFTVIHSAVVMMVSTDVLQKNKAQCIRNAKLASGAAEHKHSRIRSGASEHGGGPRGVKTGASEHGGGLS